VQLARFAQALLQGHEAIRSSAEQRAGASNVHGAREFQKTAAIRRTVDFLLTRTRPTRFPRTGRHADRDPPPGGPYAFSPSPPQPFKGGDDAPLIGGADPGKLEMQCLSRDLQVFGKAPANRARFSQAGDYLFLYAT
jgi:hypothetical protein